MTANADRASAGPRGGLAGARLAVVAASLLVTACVTDPPEERQAPPDEGQQLLERGVRAYERRDYEAAAADFTEALSYYRSYDLADGIVRSRINLARIELDLGRPEIARDHLAAAREAAARSTGSDFSARLDLLESTAALELGMLDRAARRIEPHLPELAADESIVTTESGPSAEQLSFLANRVTLAFERGDDNRGRWVERLAKALAARDQASPLLAGRLARFQAHLAAADGQDQRALDLLEGAMARYRQARNRAGIAAALEQAAAIHANHGDDRLARDHLDRALYLHLAIRNARATRANLDKRLAWLDPQAERREALRSWRDRLTTRDELDWGALRDAVIGDTPTHQ